MAITLPRISSDPSGDQGGEVCAAMPHVFMSEIRSCCIPCSNTSAGRLPALGTVVLCIHYGSASLCEGHDERELDLIP